jgi:hypothetical protein
MKYTTDDGNFTRVFLKDFKTIFDNDIMIDFGTEWNETEIDNRLYMIINLIAPKIQAIYDGIIPINISGGGTEKVDLNFVFEPEVTVISGTQFLYTFFKTNLYYIYSYFTETDKELYFEAKPLKNEDYMKLYLRDYQNERSKNDYNYINQVRTSYKRKDPVDTYAWIETTQTVWAQAVNHGSNTVQAESKNPPWPSPVFPSSVDPDYCYRHTIMFHNFFLSDRFYIYKHITERFTLTGNTYYLGRDNNIYFNVIDPEQVILPITLKQYYSTEDYNNVLFDAVYELANNRYNMNIQVNVNPGQDPVDLTNYHDFQFFQTEEGEIPISQIHEIRKRDKIINKVLTLGFKKTLLTQIIKGDKK